MISPLNFQKEIDLIISNAIREDVGDGDHSSLACIPKKSFGKANLVVKSNGVLSGVGFALKVFKYVDPELQVNIKINDGSNIKIGDIAVSYTHLTLPTTTSV